jgi:hypothetical protein
MLNKARDDTVGVTTLKLARGSISNSPPHPGSTPSSWSGSSPDLRGKPSGMQILGNVSIVELLEQDERPTFIIDVANPANFMPGVALQVLFANASLRADEVSLSNVLVCREFYNIMPNFWNVAYVSLS